MGVCGSCNSEEQKQWTQEELDAAKRNAEEAYCAEKALAAKAINAKRERKRKEAQVNIAESEFTMADTNHDYEISREEFEKAFGVEAAKEFDRLDSDGNGT